MKSSLRVLLRSVAAAVGLCVFSGFPAHAAASPATTSAESGADTAKAASPVREMVVIPGPLRSFLRMAGISQKVSKEEVLPLLARNVYLRGFQQNTPTEFLILIDRYLNQARELQVLAGTSGTIRVNSCDDAGTLVQILGYRLREGCGQKDFTLETANPERAFLTIDSGFPLVELEEALQRGTPFSYTYPTSLVPVLFHQGDWIGLSQRPQRNSGDVVGALLSDPAVSRLYWALTKTDSETSLALQSSPGLRRLLPVASILDFYGSQICIRSGRVIVPGGAGVVTEWKDLAGASPDAPGEFVNNLLAKDNGWLAAYFDALSRVSQAQQIRLTQDSRLKQLYDVFRRGSVGSNAVKGVFPRAPDLLVLFTRVQWEANGEPHVPGDMAVWKEILLEKADSKVVHSWVKRAKSWDRPEQLLETMTALATVDTDSGPLQIYLTMSELDRGRKPGERLSAATVRMMADRFTRLNNWYLVFAEFPSLNDACINHFLTTVDSIDKISNPTLRGNALGSFQASIGLWQILARQGQIPQGELSASWQKVIGPFATASTSTQLFDGTRTSVEELLRAAGANANSTQEQLVQLLAGPTQSTPDGLRVHTVLAARINSVLDDQRLVSLDTLFALSNGMKEVAEGKGKGDALLPLAAELHEFDLPRPIFTNSEKISWAPPNYTAHHAELQVRTDLTKIIKEQSSRAQLETARGQLTPFLRDTLVGLNYAYYEPPGAQMLHHNPLFVRSHDFLGLSIQTPDRLWGSPLLLGAGSPAGGGAYLVGSLVDLSYALAITEQDFLSPENVQALIWKDLVPELLVGATLPRWWSVTPVELHAVTLYQRSGEELLTASAEDEQIRERVIAVLSDRLTSQRLERVQRALMHADDTATLLPLMTPSETSYLAAEYRNRFPEEKVTWGPASQQLQELRVQSPAEVSWERLSRDFGVPHPTMARTNGCDLLNVKPFPFFGSYSSRLFGESWESSNLYWARLADEMGYSPAALNSLVPELSRRAITKIFATEPDDWPAILRAFQETGQEFRQNNSAGLAPSSTVTTLSERQDAAANTP